ncbi:hypothetical protein IMPR6_20235 [Imperialibacter sp. EC-SDR9]|nr:hypothetical protein IMPERIA75_420053 [Imperialibacter sp. 75]CAD5294187.1 hypothetical protein IMPERIA89_660051 [Imperialibacter sp. 89]VVT12625.1 hypothetical protein IMPR6_20235 [Imperialibacter sp. EC-SDR9]
MPDNANRAQIPCILLILCNFSYNGDLTTDVRNSRLNPKLPVEVPVNLHLYKLDIIR